MVNPPLKYIGITAVSALFVAAISAAPVKEWDKRFGGSGTEHAHGIKQTSDGGYIASGWSTSGADGDKSGNSRGDRDCWVVKIDGGGVKQWDRRFGGSGSDDAFNIFETSDGGWVIGGGSESGVDGDKTEESRGGVDYWIVKFSAPSSGETPSIGKTASSAASLAMKGRNFNQSFGI